MRHALAALLLFLPAPAAEPAALLELRFQTLEDGGIAWTGLHRGVVDGPNALPYVVPPGFTLTVDQITAAIRMPGAGQAGWRLDVAEAEGEPLLAFFHEFMARAPLFHLGPFITYDEGLANLGITLPSASHIAALCTSPPGSVLRELILRGRLREEGND